MTLSAEILIPKLAALSRLYQTEVLVPGMEQSLELKLPDRKAIRAALRDPMNSLKTFFGCFAFARAGGEQAGYGKICIKLLCDSQYRDGQHFLAAFREACMQKGFKTNDKLTSDVVLQGYNWHFGCDGKGAPWFEKAGSQIRETGRVLPIYLDLLLVRGIGEKIAAFLCRDLVWIFDCEDRLLSSEKLLIQPIDRWVRSISVQLWPEFEKFADRTSLDFLFASNICAATAKLKQSDVEFNQGSWYFGSQRVRDSNQLLTQLEVLQSSASTVSRK